jgi:hypothetical protein
MATTIVLKNSVTTTNAPSSLTQGEAAVNVTDKKVWVGNAATTPIQLLGSGATATFTSVSAALNGTVGATTPSTGSFTTLTASSTLSFPSQSIPFASLPTGSVLQVVQTVYKTTATSSSGTFADTGLTATITPKFSTSKVLVLVVASGCAKDGSNTWLALKIQKNSVDLFSMNPFAGYDGTTGSNYFGNVASNYLDSPASTSALTYKMQFANGLGSGTVYVNTNNAVDTSSITLMEIAA